MADLITRAPTDPDARLRLTLRIAAATLLAPRTVAKVLDGAGRVLPSTRRAVVDAAASLGVALDEGLIPIGARGRRPRTRTT